MGLEWIGFEPTNPESPSVEEGLPPECVQGISKGRKSRGGSKDPMEAAGQVDRRVRSYRTPGTTIPSTVGVARSPAFFFSREHPPGKEKSCHPQHLALSQPGERNRGRPAGLHGLTWEHCLPCKHPIPRHLVSDGTTRLEVISNNKGLQPEETHAHPGALDTPRG